MKKWILFSKKMLNKITNLKITGVGKMKSVCSQIRTGGTRNAKLAVLSLQRFRCFFPYVDVDYKLALKLL